MTTPTAAAPAVPPAPAGTAGTAGRAGTAGPAGLRARSRTARPLAPRRAGPRSPAASTVHVVLLLAAVAAALTPVIPVYGVRALLLPVLGGLVLGAAAAALAAVRRWSAWVTVALVAAVGILAGGALTSSPRTFAGFLPTTGSIADVARAAAASWKQVLTLQPPLGAADGLLTPPYLLAFVAAAVTTTITLRCRGAATAWAVTAPVACLAAAALLGTREAVLPLVVGTGLAVVLVVWSAWRAGRLRPGRVVALVLLLAVAAAGGTAGGAVVEAQRDRFVLRDELVPPFDPRDYASPLSGFRQFVKNQRDATLFTVTGLPAGARVRLATLDRYDGVVWNVAGEGVAEGSGEYRRVGEVITDDPAAGERTRVEITIGDLAGVWLPTVGEATSVSFADPAELAELRYNDATGAAVVTGGVRDGLTYTLDTVVPPVPDDRTIGGAAAADVSLPPSTGVPDLVAASAADVAREAGEPVQVARAIATALTENGFFSHGLTDLGDYPSLSGHGADRMAALLGSGLMVGDGEQYASAMALMAREMGLPARVVLGFVPDAAEPDESVVVTGDDIQAWVEIAFQGYGWVAFDPTPPETQTPQEETETTPTEPQPQVVQPPPPPPPPVTPPDDDTEQPQTESDDDRATTPLWQQIAIGVAVGSGVILLLLLPAFVVVLAKLVRRRRRRRAAAPLARVTGGWDEVLDLADDLRRAPPVLATRREKAAGIGRAFDAPPSDGGGAVAPAVARLADRADAAVFGPGVPDEKQTRDYWREVDAAMQRMRQSVPRRARLRGRVTLRSLRRRPARTTTTHDARPERRRSARLRRKGTTR